MRYHSVLFQTVLNGNNFILDYTNKKSGKIRSFLDEYGLNGFYKSRYINLLEDDITNLQFDFNEEKNGVDWDFVESDIMKYCSLIKKVLDIENGD